MMKGSLTDQTFSFGDFVNLSTSEEADVEELRKFLQGRKHNNITINAIRPSGEDCFMRI